MSDSTFPDPSEQEIIRLRDAVKREKRKKADELLAHRLVYSAIIFVILFLILVRLLDNASTWVQWLSLIAFFVVVLLVAGKIAFHYDREKREADIDP